MAIITLLGIAIFIALLLRLAYHIGEKKYIGGYGAILLVILLSGLGFIILLFLPSKNTSSDTNEGN